MHSGLSQNPDGFAQVVLPMVFAHVSGEETRTWRSTDDCSSTDGLVVGDIIWVNYNDLTTTSLEIMVSKGNHPQMGLIQVSEIL